MTTLTKENGHLNLNTKLDESNNPLYFFSNENPASARKPYSA